AHGGRLNSSGCHNQRSDNTYHCHKGALAGQSFQDIEAANEADPAGANIYQRKNYLSSWPDDDMDCQNLRHEILIDQSLIEVSFTNPNHCVVFTGRWIEPYAGNVVDLASDLDVDHVIPLAYAHAHGGSTWSAEQRRRFATDERNLLLVDDGENRRKGAKGPSEYLPRKEFQCQYAKIWNLIALEYQISIAAPDKKTMTSIVNLCKN
ncbi:HNH endonuclease, partial [Gammaproteobacteria bacterium]|nr:HNH endonuclease [Gammaproteobacteria bacterium]